MYFESVPPRKLLERSKLLNMWVYVRAKGGKDDLFPLTSGKSRRFCNGQVGFRNILRDDFIWNPAQLIAGGDLRKGIRCF